MSDRATGLLAPPVFADRQIARGGHDASNLQQNSLARRTEPGATVPVAVAGALTPRETECLYWASEGKTQGECGTILGISAKTVDYHLQNTFRKLDASNVTNAVKRALKLGLID